MSENSLSKHERRMLRREGKKEQRDESEQQERKQKSRKNMLYIVAGILIIAGIAYGATSFPATGNHIASTEFDLSGIPNSFVHWHADVDIFICGEKQQLPEALSGGHQSSGIIGVGSLHTHDHQANLNSFPGSDGNGVIHSEAVILRQPQEQTVGKFLDLMSIPFSEEQIMDKRNGDSCPDGSIGNVKFTVNGIENTQWRNYIPRDNDFIVIEFSE